MDYLIILLKSLYCDSLLFSMNAEGRGKESAEGHDQNLSLPLYTKTMSMFVLKAPKQQQQQQQLFQLLRGGSV